jgi:hypothetical protein
MTMFLPGVVPGMVPLNGPREGPPDGPPDAPQDGPDGLPGGEMEISWGVGFGTHFRLSQEGYSERKYGAK